MAADFFPEAPDEIVLRRVGCSLDLDPHFLDPFRFHVPQRSQELDSLRTGNQGFLDQHHQMAHTQPQQLVAVNQFFMSQLAYLCARMAEVREGDRTLLDNTTIMHCSSMLHGNHDARQLPVILLGGAGGRLRGGRVLDYLNAPNRRMCSLFLSLMDWGGLELDRFGDSTVRLTGL